MTRERLIRGEVDRLLAAGVAVLGEQPRRGPVDHVVMADPEGAELCIL